MDGRFKKNLTALISDNKLYSYKFLLAVSGGMDSIFLLHMFAGMQKSNNFKLAIAHYNYQTSSSSIQSEKLCRYYAEKFNIPIHIKKIENPIKNNFEATARKLRYDFFYSLLNKYNYTNIITAHHKNDQAETLFMKKNEQDNLVSMLGIRSVNKKVLRPLLDIPKKNISNYMNRNKIKYIDDLTNNDNSYLRNKIRNIELKKTQNKKVVENLFSRHEKAKDLFDLYSDWISANRKKYILYNNYYHAIEINRKVLDFISADFIKVFIQSEILKYFDVHIIKTDNFWSLLYQFILDSKIGKYFILSESIKLYSYKNKFIISFLSHDNNLDIKEIGALKKDSLWNGTKFEVKYVDSLDVDNKYSICIDKNIYDKGIKILSYSSCSSRIKKICENNYVYNYMKKKCPVVLDSNDEILWIPGVKTFVNQNMKDNFVKLNWNI